MIEYHQLSPKQQQGIHVVVKEVLFLTEEEQAAIGGQIEMTQERFEQCLRSMIRIGSHNGFFRLYDEFPKQAAIYQQHLFEKYEDQQTD